MPSTPVPTPPFSTPLTDAEGYVSRAWRPLIQALFTRTGGVFDKVEAAYSAARSAAPASAEVVAGAGLQGGGQIGPNVPVALYSAITSVANLPPAAAEGDWAYALDGRKAGEAAGAGTGVPCWWSNGAWCAVDGGAVVEA
ncbi:MAG TPA: hypothetical protein VK801_07195 [Caulobacteraceae bacterium]|jgi:hypothetical protein|nr:hypothetical protein [Caulobacteraceae bacterium]